VDTEEDRHRILTRPQATVASGLERRASVLEASHERIPKTKELSEAEAERFLRF
jgi:hypothetical protein